MDNAQAQETLLDLDQQVFFSKLASAGIVPTNEAEAQTLFELGTTLPQLKQASAPAVENRFATYAQQIEAAAVSQGVVDPMDESMKTAAALLDRDPAILEAVTTLCNARLQADA